MLALTVLSLVTMTLPSIFMKRSAVSSFQINPMASRKCNPSRLYSNAETETTFPRGNHPTRLSDDIPLLLAEGLFAVNKPLNWTSSDVVMYIRNMLQSDTRARGGTVAKIKSKGKRKMTVGHGGTLDPLATGVLVIGVGKGTKELQKYLSGSKKYTATGEFGFETTTLDMDGEVTKRAPYDHITIDAIQAILPTFTGTIEQVPPIFSALKQNGKKLYELGRKGQTAEGIGLQPRPTTIYDLQLLNPSDNSLPSFHIAMECAGGTYVRSLIRDIGYKLDSVATTTVLTRTQQGPFTLEDAIQKEDWTPANVYASIEKFNAQFETLDAFKQTP